MCTPVPITITNPSYLGSSETYDEIPGAWGGNMESCANGSTYEKLANNIYEKPPPVSPTPGKTSTKQKTKLNKKTKKSADKK